MSQPDNNRELLERMLGPQGPEIGCDECFDRLDEFVELELAGSDADAQVPGLRAHLAGCPACHEEYQALRELVGDGTAAGPGAWPPGAGSGPAGAGPTPPAAP